MSRLLASWAQTSSLIRRILRRLRAESPRALALGMATAVAQAALLVPIALAVRHVFDDEISRHRTGGIVWSGLLVLVLYGASALLGYLSRASVLRTTTGVAKRLRMELFDKLYALPQAWHHRRAAGVVHSLAVQDTERVEMALADLANPILPAALVGACLVILALVINPPLFLVLLAVVPAYLLVGRRLGRRVSAASRAWAASSRRYSADTQLLLRAMTLTRVEGAEAWELRRSQERVETLAEDFRALGVARASSSSVQNAVGAVAGSAILIVGGISVARNAMTLGELLSFYAVLALLLRQVHVIGWGLNTVLLGTHSLTRIQAVLDTRGEEQPESRGRALEFRGEVAFEDVGFAYEDAPVLRDVRLAIRPSERVALVGPNGAGKTTLVSLLLGLYRPEQGRLLADGVPFDELDVRALRRRIGVVLQDPVLFPGTIRDNIAYGRPDASDVAVQTAAADATAATFIEALPDGYATPVGDEGTGLSGGLRQRIAVARALLGRPALLVLDEPTTYLDEAAVTALMARLMALPQAPTVLLVTHDPHVATHTDRVIELRDGRIVADSRAEQAELAASSGP